ncbi:hypothetical protein BKA69DRAFT_805067 [Paraphysoderma sedebokerense]|nr:hypothetical protein BKA69DRAFT_805067 [Paraphysoderma sedebokerense]
MSGDKRKRTVSIMTNENESGIKELDDNTEDGAIPQLDSLRRQLQNFSYQLHDLQKQLPSSSASSFNEGNYPVPHYSIEKTVHSFRFNSVNLFILIERLSSTYEGPLPPPPENYHPPPTHPNLPSVGLHLKMPSTIPLPLDNRSLISESPSISQSTYSHSYHIPVPLYNTLNYPRRKKPISDNISNRNHPVPTPSSRTDSGLRTALPNSPLFPITPVPANPPGSGHICMWELQVCCHETSSKSKDAHRKPKLCSARFATGEKLYQHLVNEHIASEPADRCNFCHWRGCLKIFKNKSRYLRRDHFKKHITDLVELICLDCGRVCEKDYITGKHFCSEKEKVVDPNAEVEAVESSAEEETVVADNDRLDSKVTDTADSLLLTDQQVMTPELLSPEPMAEDIIVPHPNIDPSYMFPSITSSPADGSAQIRQDPETITLLNDLGDSISHLRTEQTTQRQIIDSLSETLQSQIEHRNLPADNLADPEVQKALGYASDIHDTVTLLLQRITEHIGSAAVATASSAENAAEEHRQLADALGNLNSEQANVRTLLEKLSKCEDASAQSLENVRQDLKFGNDIVFDRLEKLEMQLEKVATSTVNLIDRLASDDSTENEPVEWDLSSISVLLQPSFDSLHSKLQSLNETLNQSTVSHQSSLMESERRQVEGIIASISPQITDMSDSIQQITMLSSHGRKQIGRNQCINRGVAFGDRENRFDA